jgi:SAM-dependent methyltransferase
MLKKDRLTKRDYWDNFYREHDQNTKSGSIKRVFRKLLGEKIFQYSIENYSEYIFWEICKRNFPKKEGLKILEIGSAPGTRLIKFHENFGYIPYGVEYSKDGFKLNKTVFRLNGINEDNVIYADFFSNEFQHEYRNYFDVVISMGFIEHFFDSKNTIENHLNVLKEDGFCLISIPNFRGINYVFMNVLNRKLKKLHNFEIMDIDKIKQILTDFNMKIIYADYYGVFNLLLVDADIKNLFIHFISVFLIFIQIILNFTFRIFFKDNRIFENKISSPFLMVISQKRD